MVLDHWQAVGLWSSWGWCLTLVVEAGPKARAGLLVGGAKTQGIWGLTSTRWWAELLPRVSGCRALGVLGLVPAGWCVGLGPVSFGGQGYVQGCLWPQEVLR